MQITYDPRHNVAYIRLQEKIGRVETIWVSEEPQRGPHPRRRRVRHQASQCQPAVGSRGSGEVGRDKRGRRRPSGD